MADAVLLLRRIRGHDAVDGLYGTPGVQRRKDFVAGVGQFHGDLHGFRVAHLTQDDDVRVLAESLDHTLDEVCHVGAHLTVTHDATLGGVHVFDRLGDDKNVPLEILIVGIDDGVDRRAFAGAGDPGTERQPIAGMAEHEPVLDERVKAQRMERTRFPGQHAQAQGQLLFFEVECGPETERHAFFLGF